MAVNWTDGEEHWADKDGVRLFLWRKPRRKDTLTRGVLLFVHGSSMASQPTFDLAVPGRAHSSAMDWFAAQGFDTWCMDNEGYGRSDKHRPVNADIACGVEDLLAGTRCIAAATGEAKLHLYGISSGALKAALFASLHPHRVKRLALEAFVWTGQNSPTLEERRKRLPQYQASLRRAITRADVENIARRDNPAVADQSAMRAFADAVLALDQSIPNGTYVDMCSKLPIVDPRALNVPVLIMRGEFDGIASEADVTEFFSALPHKDKQLAYLRGAAHGSFHGRNHLASYHILHAFLTLPEARDHD